MEGERERERKEGKKGEGSRARQRRINTKSILPSLAFSPSYSCVPLARWDFSEPQFSTWHERFMLHPAGLSGAGNKSEFVKASSSWDESPPCAAVFFFYCDLYLLTWFSRRTTWELHSESWWSKAPRGQKSRDMGPGRGDSPSQGSLSSPFHPPAFGSIPPLLYMNEVIFQLPFVLEKN